MLQSSPNREKKQLTIFGKRGVSLFRVAQTLAQEIQLINEVIDRADRNMRMAGTDRTSKMRKLLVRERLGYLNDQTPGEEER